MQPHSTARGVIKQMLYRLCGMHPRTRLIWGEENSCTSSSWTMMAMRATFCRAKAGDGALQLRQLVESMYAPSEWDASRRVMPARAAVANTEVYKI